MSRYRKSEEWLSRAEVTIPLGSQTFSKSRTQYPVGISPLYLSQAKGARVWDLDGNKYIDLVSSLASITLGYRDRGQIHAIRRQLKKGISLSLPARLEVELSEKLVEIIPSAEMVRFGKNGSDATSAAIRLARAYSGKEIVLVCGYHGWQDWYIGATTRNKGVPQSVAELTKVFPYNNIAAFEELLNKYSGRVAAVIMEPMNLVFPEPGYLEGIKELTHKHNAILIFDETITGFRFAPGGAQELFGVVPDLSTFGKGMANGMPISAVVGRREIMMEMEEIFFSGTFGGELLSLASANYTISEVAKGNVTSRLAQIGSLLANSIEQLIVKHNLRAVVNLSGHDSWKLLSWNEAEGATADEIRTLFLQEMYSRGILIIGSHNVNLAMTPRICHEIVSTYDQVFELISRSLSAGNLKDLLRVRPNPTLFRIR